MDVQAGASIETGLPSPQVRWRIGFWPALALAIVCAVLTANVYRAATQPITHDEAVTYDSFLAEKQYRIFTRFDANHHLLHTYLCLVSTTLLGASEFSLRIPSLCGGALYLVMCLKLCRLLYGRGPLCLLGVAILCLNPFLMDFLSLARGYSLALGFCAWTLYELARFSHGARQPALAGKSSPGIRRLSILMALTVLSNLTFVPVIAALGLVLGAVLLIDVRHAACPPSVRMCVVRLWKGLVLPGLLLLLVLGTALWRARSKDFYVGEDTILMSTHGIVWASLAHHHTTWLLDTEGPLFIGAASLLWFWGCLCLVGGLAICCGAALCRWLRSGTPLAMLAVHDRFLLLSGLGSLLMLGIIYSMHSLLHVKYPFERTGLYLVPILSLGACSTVKKLLSFPGTSRAAGGVAFAVMSVVALQFGAQWHTGYYRAWQYDSATRRMFDAICNRHPGGEGRVRVAASTILAPSLNFYRLTRGVRWMDEIKPATSTQSCDYYVLAPKAPNPDGPLLPLIIDPEVGTVLGTTRPAAPVGN